MSIKAAAPLTTETCATIHISGGDYDKLLWLSRHNISIPEMLTTDPDEQEEYADFLNRLRAVLEPSEAK